MLQITLENTGRRFNKEWIFRKVNVQFTSAHQHAILGSNGSGKSTFLQLLSGFLIPSEGNVIYQYNGKNTEQEKVYKLLSLCSPFQELYDEFTAEETYDFHASLKPMKNNISRKTFIEILELNNIKDKPLRNYSSGMRQRVKLALAILSDTPLLLLDEPCTNLDANAIKWYQQLLQNNCDNRLVLISSNSNQDEIFSCTKRFLVEDYK